MAQPLAYHLDRYVGLQQQGGMRVTQTVELDPPDSGVPHELVEQLAQSIRVDQVAVLPSEHQPGVDVAPPYALRSSTWSR